MQAHPLKLFNHASQRKSGNRTLWVCPTAGNSIFIALWELLKTQCLCSTNVLEVEKNRTVFGFALSCQSHKSISRKCWQANDSIQCFHNIHATLLLTFPPLTLQTSAIYFKQKTQTYQIATLHIVTRSSTENPSTIFFHSVSKLFLLTCFK